MSDIIYAAQFAHHRHDGQVRKFSGKPYITHPIRVAGRVAIHRKATETMVVAAFLHDVVEDTPTEISDLIEFFGEDVAELVDELTNDKTIEGNRQERKRVQREKLKNASYEAKLIKLIDRIDNLGEIPLSDGFAVVYARESLLLLEEALVGTDENLEKELRDIIALILNAD
jgi:(p)ppGpp synthase/HD superfamily hydrolase